MSTSNFSKNTRLHTHKMGLYVTLSSCFSRILMATPPADSRRVAWLRSSTSCNCQHKHEVITEERGSFPSTHGSWQVAVVLTRGHRILWTDSHSHFLHPISSDMNSFDVLFHVKKMYKLFHKLINWIYLQRWCAVRYYTLNFLNKTPRFVANIINTFWGKINKSSCCEAQWYLYYYCFIK